MTTHTMALVTPVTPQLAALAQRYGYCKSNFWAINNVYVFPKHLLTSSEQALLKDCNAIEAAYRETILTVYWVGMRYDWTPIHSAQEQGAKHTFFNLRRDAEKAHYSAYEVIEE